MPLGEIMTECQSPIEMSNWIPMMTSAYEFALKVDRQIEALSNEDYHRRVGRSKKLREELYPLSRLALHFKRPGLEVEVQGFVDCGRPDGYMRITGFLNREFEVQITYAAYGCKDALRAQLLVSEGFVTDRPKGAGDDRPNGATRRGGFWVSGVAKSSIKDPFGKAFFHDFGPSLECGIVDIQE
jgi:hypothetical protein